MRAIVLMLVVLAAGCGPHGGEGEGTSEGTFIVPVEVDPDASRAVPASGQRADRRGRWRPGIDGDVEGGRVGHGGSSEEDEVDEGRSFEK